VICQCPCGTEAISRSPFGARPYSRHMLVVAHVSSMKTSLSGFRLGCRARHSSRAAATSGRACSLHRRLRSDNRSAMNHTSAPCRKPPADSTQPDNALVRRLSNFQPRLRCFYEVKEVNPLSVLIFSPSSKSIFGSLTEAFEALRWRAVHIVMDMPVQRAAFAA
jgi:hypothetical protein